MALSSILGGGTSEFIKKAAKEQLESDLTALKNAYEKNDAVYNRQAEFVPQQYEAVKNETAAQDALARKAFAEYAAASGLANGTAGQATLARDSTLQSALTGINRDQQRTMSDIDFAKNQLFTEYQNAQAQAKSSNTAQLNNALYNDMVRKINNVISIGTAILPYAMNLLSGNVGGSLGSGLGLLGAAASALAPSAAPTFTSAVTGNELSAPKNVVGGYNAGELLEATAAGMSKAQIENTLKLRGVDVSSPYVQADIKWALGK